MHLLHKVLAERDEEEDSQHAAKEGTQGHLPEIHLYAKDVYGGKGEYGAGYNRAGAAADGLDNDVLAQALLEPKGSCKAHSDDCNGDSSLKHLAHLEAKVCRRSTEKDNHQDTHSHGIGSGFRVLLMRA